MRRDASAQREMGQTQAQHVREGEQTADSSHAFEEIHTCQNSLFNQLKSTFLAGATRTVAYV